MRPNKRLATIVRMRIATWNVNSVRARLPRVLDWLERAKPDIVALQEIKCLDDQFPWEPIQDAGYNCAVHGQKTYNGVAILARRRIEDVVRGFDGDGEGVDGVDEGGANEARVISATVEDVCLVNAYVINGMEVGHPRWHDKLAFLANLKDFVSRRFDMGEKVVVLGDFNVTFDDLDVHDPDLWREKILCSTPERAALRDLCSAGLADAFRKFHPEGGHYTWWDFRTRGFQRKAGLRIDHILMSPAALSACTAVEIDLAARDGDKPSDHAPVVATLG